MSGFEFGSLFMLDNYQRISSKFPKKRLCFKVKRKSTDLVKQLSEMSPHKDRSSTSQSPSGSKQRKLTDWMSSSQEERSSTSPSSSASELKSSSSKASSVLSQFIENGENIVLSREMKRSPQKFFKKTERSPSPKKKTPVKRKLDKEFGKSPSKLIAIDSFFMKTVGVRTEKIVKEVSVSSVECITLSDDSDFGCSPAVEDQPESLDNINTDESKLPISCTDVVEENLTSCDWDNDPFLNDSKSVPLEVVKKVVDEQLVRSPQKKSPPEGSRNFEYLVSYLIKNPLSDQAARDGILSHNDILKLIRKLEELSRDAQMLYKRLYGRTKTWYRLKNDFNKYEHLVEDVTGSLAVLEKSQLICSDCSSEEVEVLLNLLLANELKDICKAYKLNLSLNNKNDMVQALLKYGHKQKSLSNVSTMSRIKTRVSNTLGTCFRLSEEPRRLFHILLVLTTFPYFRGEEKERLSSLELNLSALRTNTVRYPSYIIRPMQVFRNYSHLEEFAQSIQLSAELFSLIEKKEKEEASDVVVKIKKKFIEYLANKENMDMVDNLKNYLVKFTAGQTYAYCLNKGVVMLKSTDRYSEAEEVLQLLLGQTKFITGARGQWFNELALIYETQFKDVPKAMEYVSRGLADEKVSLIDRTTLTQRGLKLLKRKQIKAADGVKEGLQALIESQVNYKPPNVVITAKSISGGPGKKQVFIKETEDGKQMSSVEEYVVEFYKYEAETTYQYGRHDEGSFLMNLVVALFFDIIYSQPIENESFFLCAMQSKPLDWGSRGFYKRRKDLIDSHLENLKGGGLLAIRGHLEDLCKNVYNTESLVNWETLSIERLDKICEILECVGVETFLRLAEHVIKDFKSYRSGFPDLILWDPPTKRSLFVEVKGPNDSLSITQTIWLKNLKDFGANAVVAHVETLGTTKRRPK